MRAGAELCTLCGCTRATLALKMKPLIAKKAKEKQSEAGGAVRQKSDKAVVDTKKELAKIAGVSHEKSTPFEEVLSHWTYSVSN